MVRGHPRVRTHKLRSDSSQQRGDSPREHQEQGCWPTCSGLESTSLRESSPPKAGGVSHVDESKVLSGIIPVLRYGLRVDVPPVDGLYKTLYNCFRRWSHNGGFQLIFSELARSHGAEPEMC